MVDQVILVFKDQKVILEKKVKLVKQENQHTI